MYEYIHKSLQISIKWSHYAYTISTTITTVYSVPSIHRGNIREANVCIIVLMCNM